MERNIHRIGTNEWDFRVFVQGIFKYGRTEVEANAFLFAGSDEVELRSCPAANIEDWKKFGLIDDTGDFTFAALNEGLDQPIIEPP